MRLSDAVDRYMGERARAGKAAATRRKDYQILSYLMDELGENSNVADITYLDLAHFIDRWKDNENSTLALSVSLTKGFFRFLRKHHLISENPAENLERPKLKRPEDKNVVTITGQEVEKMFRACETLQERLCLGVFGYQAVRRSAAARLRWRDVDLDKRKIKYLEKGGKTISKRIPERLMALLYEALESDLPTSDEDYVIPSYEPGKVRREERDPRIVYMIVKRVAERAGVNSHCHAIRAAFAVSYLEQRPDRLMNLKEMMGHSELETTRVYLRKLESDKLLEDFEDFDYAPYEGGEDPSVLPTEAVEAHTGFEPVLRTNDGTVRSRRVHEAHSDATRRTKVRIEGQDASLRPAKKRRKA